MTRVLFTGGPVVTFDSRPANSLIVDDGVITAVGQDIAATGVDEVVSLEQRSLLPAFRDGHAHPLHGGRNALELNLAGATHLDELLRMLEAWARLHPSDPWIIGYCYSPSILPRGLGRAEWLDAACNDRPVALYPSDFHAVWANSTALETAHITRDSPDPDLGTVVRNGDRSPTGMLLEFGAMALLQSHMPATSRDSQDRGLESAMRSLTSEGIVWAQDASVTLDELDVYVDTARSGKSTCRFNAAFRAEPNHWTKQRAGFINARATLDAGTTLQWVTANTIKFFADGVIEAGTGFLLEPYEDADHSCGLPNWTAEGLKEAVRSFDHDGFQIHIHAIGDAGVRMALDSIEHAIVLNGNRDRRPVIAHTQLVHPDDRHRFATLRVIANFEPLWACLDESQLELTVPRIGPTRSALQYPIGSILALGGRVSFGSDWPVSSHRPLDGLGVAVTRQTRTGQPAGGWVPEERIPILEAIRAYTQGCAYQAFDDDAGAIAVGQRADLVVLDRDITAVAGAEVADAAVDETWANGQRVYCR